MVGPYWLITTLPDGQQVPASPRSDSGPIARRLGYGEDVAALTRDHDLLHSLLADWLGQPYSHSLAQAAGLPADSAVAALEEDVVLALQRYINALPAPPGAH